MESAPYRQFLYFVVPVAGLLGATTGATAALALAAAVCATLVLAFVFSRRALLGLRLARRLYPSAFEDDAVRVELFLENRSTRPAFLLELGDSFGPSVADRQAMLEPGPLAAGRRRILAYRSFCSRPWGEYRVGPLTISASDPLGLFRARRSFPQIELFGVFPRAHAVDALTRLGSRPSLAPHDATAGRSGQSHSYLGVRDYRAGDDARRIHWPATARRGALAVKEYELDLLPYLTLFLDLHRAARAGTGRKSTLEYVVRAAASFVCAAAERGDIVQLLAEDRRTVFVPPGRGELHRTQCLYELVRARQEGQVPILDLVARQRAHLPERSTAVLLIASLGFEDAQLEETLEALRARAVRSVVLVVNDASFLPVERWPLPPERVQDRCRMIVGVLQSHGAGGAILSAEQDLAAELARPDLLEAGA